jgi:hypothetical protein
MTGERASHETPPPVTSPVTQSPRNLRRRLFVLALAAGAILFLALCGLFDPAQHSFFPRCYFHQFTNLHCPGCGSQRAIHHLLHGNLATALRSNALFCALAVAGIFALLHYLAARVKRHVWISPFRHTQLWWLLAALFVVFGILRNLPGFGWLAP